MMDYHYIIILLCLALIMLRYITSILIPDELNIKKYITTTLTQYTFWNLSLIFVNIFYQDEYFERFIFINTTVIFIIYYILHFVYRQKIKTIPNVPSSFSESQIEIIMFLVHAVPFLYYLFRFIQEKEKIKINYNIGYETALLNLSWKLLCFSSFDPMIAYFKINENYLYYIWCFLIVLHISIGWILNNV